MDTEKPHREGERERPPPSSTSSPSNDFSFTVSVLPSPIPSPNLIKCSKTTTPSIAMAPAPAPADDIFFHGHLLPLHLLSHPPISPRPSDVSIENLSLPLGLLRGDASVKHQNHHGHSNTETRERTGLKSLSSFFGLGKWRKASNVGEEEKKKKKKKKKKKVFDVSRFLKKYYASMVEPLFFFKWEREKRDIRRRPYSFSGHSNPKERAEWRGKRGEFSAPASMRTSPTNSGVLSMTCNPSDESTMEELQNAIQAAIAHCKNSAARKEERERCDG